MSTMHCYVAIQPANSVEGVVRYIREGREEMAEMHRAAGTDRFAAMYCDAPSPEAFVIDSQRQARANSRKREAYSLVMSPPEGTFDKDNPDDMQALCDAAVEGARRAYPGKKLLVGVHNDSKGSHDCGGKPHAHIIVQNHDVETGRAVTDNRTAVKLRGIFNKMGAELDWAETEVTYEHTKGAPFGEPVKELELAGDDPVIDDIRARLADVGAFDLELFDDAMAARDAATGSTYAEWEASFEAELLSRDVKLKKVAPRNAPHLKKSSAVGGLVYERINHKPGKNPGRAASKLGEPLKLKGLQRAFDLHKNAPSLTPSPVPVVDPMAGLLDSLKADLMAENDEAALAERVARQNRITEETKQRHLISDLSHDDDVTKLDEATTTTTPGLAADLDELERRAAERREMLKRRDAAKKKQRVDRQRVAVEQGHQKVTATPTPTKAKKSDALQRRIDQHASEASQAAQRGIDRGHDGKDV